MSGETVAANKQAQINKLGFMRLFYLILYKGQPDNSGCITGGRAPPPKGVTKEPKKQPCNFGACWIFLVEFALPSKSSPAKY
jgi:hypothetical protein